MIEYVYYLSCLQEDRLRVFAWKEKKQILQFVVQYEAMVRGQWRPIVRYDTRHGFAHKDLVRPDGLVDKQPLPFHDYNLALTYATEDLKRNWQYYRRQFEEENDGS